jgi:hypothetical protein
MAASRSRAISDSRSGDIFSRRLRADSRAIALRTFFESFTFGAFSALDPPGAFGAIISIDSMRRITDSALNFVLRAAFTARTATRLNFGLAFRLSAAIAKATAEAATAISRRISGGTFIAR